MKTITLVLSIFLTSIFCEPLLASTNTTATPTEINGKVPKIKHHKHKKLKKRRSAHTCLNKNGCKKHKLFKKKKSNCTTY